MPEGLPNEEERGAVSDSEGREAMAQVVDAQPLDLRSLAHVSECFAKPDRVAVSLDRRKYTRIGGRVGVLGVFNPTPDNSITFWAAYTDFEPLKGFDRDLGEIQTQVNFTFSAATLAFTWRNGRREDTAKRDSTYKVTLGFKTK